MVEDDVKESIGLFFGVLIAVIAYYMLGARGLHWILVLSFVKMLWYIGKYVWS